MDMKIGAPKKNRQLSTINPKCCRNHRINAIVSFSTVMRVHIGCVFRPDFPG